MNLNSNIVQQIAIISIVKCINYHHFDAVDTIATIADLNKWKNRIIPYYQYSYSN